MARFHRQQSQVGSHCLHCRIAPMFQRVMQRGKPEATFGFDFELHGIQVTQPSPEICCASLCIHDAVRVPQELAPRAPSISVELLRGDRVLSSCFAVPPSLPPSPTLALIRACLALLP